MREEDAIIVSFENIVEIDPTVFSLADLPHAWHDAKNVLQNYSCVYMEIMIHSRYWLEGIQCRLRVGLDQC